MVRWKIERVPFLTFLPSPVSTSNCRKMTERPWKQSLLRRISKSGAQKVFTQSNSFHQVQSAPHNVNLTRNLPFSCSNQQHSRLDSSNNALQVSLDLHTLPLTKNLAYSAVMLHPLLSELALE
mmetsp:Transcript_6072/g.22992  ORF Transcript_6072/g.22992 Transcript_6072/m.22992 type:complete len:123 (-) Transcript_6072:3521-3889(-)